MENRAVIKRRELTITERRNLQARILRIEEDEKQHSATQCKQCLQYKRRHKFYRLPSGALRSGRICKQCLSDNGVIIKVNPQEHARDFYNVYGRLLHCVEIGGELPSRVLDAIQRI